MKGLNLTAFIPVMDILLTFGDDEIEVNITNNNPEGQPQIDVYNVGGTDVDEDTRKEYTDFVINKIKSGELKLPDSIVLYTTTGHVSVDEYISING